MTNYLQLSPSGEVSQIIDTTKNIEWDSTHYCPAEKLTSDEAVYFRVHLLHPCDAPVFDPTTHSCQRDGAEYVAGQWQYKWRVDALTPEQIEANYQASIPQSVTMRQARLALLGAGLLSSVDAAIAAMPEPDKTAAQITWEFAATVDRGFGMVPQLAAALGMTELQIDALFVAAAAL